MYRGWVSLTRTWCSDPHNQLKTFLASLMRLFLTYSENGMWRHKRRNHIRSSSETDESIYIGGGVSSVEYWMHYVPSQAEDCWLPTPFASFPFTSPSRASACATKFRFYSTTPDSRAENYSPLGLPMQWQLSDSRTFSNWYWSQSNKPAWSLYFMSGSWRQGEFLLSWDQPSLADGTVTNETLHTHQHV